MSQIERGKDIISIDATFRENGIPETNVYNGVGENQNHGQNEMEYSFRNVCAVLPFVGRVDRFVLHSLLGE